jgi:hypothetical protein
MDLTTPESRVGTPPWRILLAAAVAVLIGLWILLHVYTGPWFVRSDSWRWPSPGADSVRVDSLVERR